MSSKLFGQSRRFSGSALAVLSVSVLCSVLLPARTFAYLQNGAAAIDELGQYDDSLTNPQPVYTKSAANNGPNSLGISGPVMVAVDMIHHRLFVAENKNNRVLIFLLNTDNTISSHIPAYVLGQANFHSNAFAATQAGMRTPDGVAYDSVNNRVFFSLYGQNRILVFDVSTVSNGMNATYVLGQSGFTGTGAATTQTGLSGPTHLAYDTTTSRLFVSDITNNRVLVFSGASLSTGMAANTVLGQPNFTSNTSALTQTGMHTPYGIVYDNATTHLFVADYANNRVLVFSGASLSNGMTANTVLGQSSFTTNTAATTQSGMSHAIGVSYDSTNNRLFITEEGNNRILVFSGASLSTGMNATSVLGQASFTTATAATTQTGMNLPQSAIFDNSGKNLYISEWNNNRILIFNAASISNGMNASDALGEYDDSLTNPQPVYTKSAANNGPNVLGFNGVRDAALDTIHHRLFALDVNNSGVLVYTLNADNTLPDRIPEYLLGQPDFHANAVATTQTGMNAPTGLTYDGNNDRLFVSDFTNNRVLVYNTAVLSNGMNASYVLGQTTFTTNTGATTQSGMNGPANVFYDTSTNRLFSTEYYAKRVLVYDLSSGISNGMNASWVLGQNDFTHGAGATTQAGLLNPRAVTYDPTHKRLFIADFGASRIMVYNLTGGVITNGMSGSYVLGQSSFTTSIANATQSGLNLSPSLAYDTTENRLFVADSSNHRVLVFKTATITNGMNATNVIGQADFTSNTASSSQSGLHAPQHVSYDPASGQLFVVDVTNNRIMVFDATPSTQTTLTSSTSTSNLGSPVTFIVSVLPSDVTGTATINGATNLGTITLGHGSGSLTTTALLLGSQTVTATYNGDSTYLTSTSNTLTQIVNGAGGSTTTTTSGGGGGGGGGGTRRVIATTTTASSSSTKSTTQASTPSAPNSSPVTPTPPPPRSLTTLTTPTALRTAPSSSAPLIASMLTGWQVTIDSSDGTWASVHTLHGKQGFLLVSSFQASPVTPVSSNSTRLVGTSLRMHTAPSVSSPSVTTLSPDQVVTLLAKQGDWAKVQYHSFIGWVVSRYLRK